jgi:DNA-binding transcriptional regulator YdaS (Cro superfamily)
MASFLDLLKRTEWTPRKLARALSAQGEPITSQAIHQWKVVPPTRVLAVEELTRISRHDLNPQVFGQKPGEAA